MAYEKQNWKDALQAAKSKGSRSDDNVDQRKKAKEARVMYAKRLLDKDIKKLLNNKIIKYNDIVRIHGKHGIYTTWTLQRKNNPSYENVKLLFKWI